MTIAWIFGAKYLFVVALGIAAVGFYFLSPSDRKKVALLALISLPVAFLLSRIAGWLYVNPRPFVVDHFTPLISHVADNGFPSDHTLLISVVAMLFWWSKKNISLLLWALALLVGISRVTVGVHHPIDIIGSMLISICTVVLVHIFLKTSLKLL